MPVERLPNTGISRMPGRLGAGSGSLMRRNLQKRYQSWCYTVARPGFPLKDTEPRISAAHHRNLILRNDGALFLA